MAPKKQARSIIHPTELDQVTAGLDEIESGQPSGWRERSDVRVTEMVNSWLIGGYDLTLLKDPALRGVNGKPKTTANGLYIIADGSHKDCALRRLKAIYDDVDQCDQYVWTDKLVDAITTPIKYRVLEFQDDDDDLMLAYMVAIHEESANKAIAC